MTNDINFRVNADVTDFVSGFKRADDSLEKITQSTRKLTPSLADIKAGFDMGAEAAQYIQKAIEATVTPTMELAKQQRDLARASGQSAEDAGALIQSADDLGVSYESLLGASKKLNAEGFSLNISNLKALSDEYRALPTPVAKAQFAAEKFGRAAGPEMQKLLEQGSEAIQQMTDSARDSALVLSTENVNAARELEIAQDSLNDAMEEAKVLVGVELIPILTDLANFTTGVLVPAVQTAADTWHAGAESFNSLVKITALGIDQFHVMTGEITAADAAANAYAIANNGLTQAQEAAIQSQRSLSAETERWNGLASQYIEQENSLAAAQNVALSSTDALSIGMQKYTDLLLFNKAAANLDADAALALGIAMGVVDTQSILASQSVDVLKQKYDANHDGAISATEAASGYSAAVIGLQSAISALPDSKTIQINIQTNGSVPNIPGTGGSPNTPIPLAGGANFIANRPTYLLVGEAGPEHVKVTPQTNSTTNNYNLQMTNYGGKPSIPDLFQQQQRANAGAW